MIRGRLVRLFSLQSSKALASGDQATLTKKITAQDIQKFIELSGDSNSVHSEDTGKRAVVHGAYLNSLVSCVMGTKLPGPDDVVTVTVRIVDARKIVKVAFVCDVEAENKTVLFGDAQLVIDKANRARHD